MATQMNYWNSIRAAREAHNFTQFDLAVVINTRDTDVSRWKRGVLAPKVATFVAISNALGVPLDYLADVVDKLVLNANWVNPRE